MMGGIVERVLPFSEEAERALLGAVMLEPLRTAAVWQGMGISAEAFYVPAHRVVAGAIEVLMADPRAVVDLVSVRETLATHGRLDGAGGLQFLTGLVDGTPTAAHAHFYAAKVRDRWMMRRAIEAARKIEQEAFEWQGDAEPFVTAAPDKFSGIVQRGRSDRTNAEVLEEQIVRWEDAKAFQEGDKSKAPAIGLATPWPELTGLMCGLEVGLTIVAGRPSAGKTTLEDSLATCVAATGKRVLRVSLDSSQAALLARAACRQAGVSMPKLKFGFARKSQLSEVREAAKGIGALPMTIRTDLYDVAQIRQVAIQMARTDGLGLLTVDYVQQVQAAELGWQAGNTVAKTTHVSGRLKQLAYELGIPVVLLAQMSRAVETDGRAEPRLSDLRDSGALEQDADKVLFIYVDRKKRKEMEERELGATKHKRPIMFNLAKQKDGETGGMEMWMHAPYFRFEVAQPMWADDQLVSDKEPERPAPGSRGVSALPGVEWDPAETGEA
jgi:replicative DNA helicase